MDVVFDGDNSYPDCQCCGFCCELAVLAVTDEEISAICDYLEETGIEPIDYGFERCVFQLPEKRCAIWPVRTQTCKLHNCHVPREKLVEMNPDLVIPEKKLICIREAFINGNFTDVREMTEEEMSRIYDSVQ